LFGFQFYIQKIVLPIIISIINIDTATQIISRRNLGLGGLLQIIQVPFHSCTHRSWAVYLHPHSGSYSSFLNTGS